MTFENIFPVFCFILGTAFGLGAWALFVAMRREVKVNEVDGATIVKFARTLKTGNKMVRNSTVITAQDATKMPDLAERAEKVAEAFQKFGPSRGAKHGR